jgi:hypothetical protein
MTNVKMSPCVPQPKQWKSFLYNLRDGVLPPWWNGHWMNPALFGLNPYLAATSAMLYCDLISSTDTLICQNLHNPAPGLPLVAKFKPDPIFVFHRVQNLEQFPSVHSFGTRPFPGIAPKINVLKAGDLPAMLTQDHNLYSVLLCPDQLRPEAIVLLADIPA